MTNEVKKVPQLRFQNFGGEWEEKQLGDVTKTNQGLQIAISDRKTKYEKGLYFYITNEFLRPNSQTKYYIENPPESVVAEKSDILMTRTGNTGKVITNVEGAFHNNFFKIKYNKSIIDRLFLFELLKSPKINNKFLSLAGTSTIPDLNHSDFYSVYISFPTISEQQKIGEFFSKLDRQIELEEQKLAKLEEQKKGYMQKLFSQELRFKTKDNVYYSEWQLHKLGEIFKYSQGKQISVDKQFSVKSNEMKRFIRIVDITENPEPRFVLYESDTGLVNKEDLFMIRYGRPGIVSIGFEGIIANNLFKLIPKIKISTVYFYYLLSYNYYRINLLTNQSTMPALNFKSLDSLKFKIPSYKEQNKIGNFFTKFDELIEKQNKKIDGLKERKKGLLQKMFV